MALEDTRSRATAGSRSAAVGEEGTAGAATNAGAAVAGAAVEATWGRCGVEKGENGQKKEGGGNPEGFGGFRRWKKQGKNAPKIEGERERESGVLPRAVVGIGGKWLKKEEVKVVVMVVMEVWGRSGWEIPREWGWRCCEEGRNREKCSVGKRAPGVAGLPKGGNWD